MPHMIRSLPFLTCLVILVHLTTHLLQAFEFRSFHKVHYPADTLDTVPFAQSATIFARRDNINIYHNYTVDKGCNTANHCFLGREIIPHHAQVIENGNVFGESASNINKRAFNVMNRWTPHAAANMREGSPRLLTWAWMRDPRSNCPVIIPFCFADSDSEKQLRDFTDAAFDEWHQALGPNRGVQFMYTSGNAQTGLGEGMCYTTDGRWGISVPNDAVVLKVNYDGDRSYSGVGWRPGHTPGRMSLKFDLFHHQPGFDDGEDLTLAAMVHEPGHVMGLDHEHQRFDADQYVKLNIEHVEHIDELPHLVDVYNQHTGAKITADQVKNGPNSLFLSFKMDSVLGSNVPQLHQLKPYIHFSTHFTDMEVTGEFDWQSVMLYPSGAFSTGEATLVKRSDGSTWDENLHPSLGDIQAVKRIYPDLVRQSP